MTSRASFACNRRLSVTKVTPRKAGKSRHSASAALAATCAPWRARQPGQLNNQETPAAGSLPAGSHRRRMGKNPWTMGRPNAGAFRKNHVNDGGPEGAGEGGR